MSEFLLHLGALLALFFVAIFLVQKIATKQMSQKLFKVLRAPAFAFIAIFFLCWGLNLLQTKWNFEMQSFTIATFRNSIFLGLFCWTFIRLRKSYLESLLEIVSDKKSPIYKETIEVVSNVLSVLVYIATFFALLQISGVNIVPFVTFGGMGLAIAGLAGKDFMSNFFAGLALKITNPFKEGEFVELPDKKISGFVQKIGFFSTKIIDEKCRLVLVPNVLFSSTSLINGSRSTHFVFSEIFDLGKMNLQKALFLEEKITQVMKTFPGIDLSKSLQISTQIIASKSIKMEVVAYFMKRKNQSFVSLRNAVMQTVIDLIEAE